MVTIVKYTSKNGTPHYEFKGLSTDTKPTKDVGVNSVFYEVDTGDVYSFQEGGEVKLSKHISSEDWLPINDKYWAGTGISDYYYFSEDGLWFDWNGTITYNPRYSDWDMTYYVPEGKTFDTAPNGIISSFNGWAFGSTTVEDVDVVITTGNAGWRKTGGNE